MSYDGGKGNTFRHIINQMPPHKVYIEPFLGMGAVMRNKRPAPDLNLGLDIDSEVIAQWQGHGLPGVQVVAGDALIFLRNYKWTGKELVYLDPPYLIDTRRDQRAIYRYELSDAEHYELLHQIRQLPCMVMISGYWSKIYAGQLPGWRTVSFQATTRGRTSATEWLWMNFPEPDQLHDYRWLGETFRERERIKRKIQRWQKNLSRMPRLERLALSAALAEVDDGGPQGHHHSPDSAMRPGCRRLSLQMAMPPPATSLNPAMVATSRWSIATDGEA